MTTNDSPRLGMRWSLRELFWLVAGSATACTALKHAEENWVIFASLVALLALIAAAIVALVDRGPRQAGALGSLAAMGVYAVLMFAVTRQSNREVHPDLGILPTTKLLGQLYHAHAEFWHVDRQTGEPTTLAAFQQYDRPPKGIVELPHPGHFMIVGHCSWMLLLGYAGKHFARWAFARRMRDVSTGAKERHDVSPLGDEERTDDHENYR